MIEEFAKFPGIGKKSAQRLAMYLFRSKDPDFQKFLDAVQSLKRDLHSCSICYNITEKEICSICSSEITKTLAPINDLENEKILIKKAGKSTASNTVRAL